MPPLRLLADDLTGALDSAARFLPLTGPVAISWRDIVPGALAFDSDTRDLDASGAQARIAEVASVLDGGDPAFKKIDSLLRGRVALELAQCMGRFDHCVLAPAFPFQGRITAAGRQRARDGEGWRDCGVDLAGGLRGLGVELQVRDATSDADLDAIVAEGRRLAGRVLWCGTGGLAGALAGRGTAPRPTLPKPVLALIGSDHAVTRAQVAAVPATLRDALVLCPLPPGLDRAEARQRIATTFAELLRRGPRPGTLFVTGGATLRDVCDALGVARLEVDGELEPGVPASILCGGAWDGQRLVSKSGAFGDTAFLARLLGEAQ
ncbi:MAG TPA: nucleotide-binding domain containing protein [Acetobacteraceae bacterium]|nr:nucleotide-binding domain containing protein [Acetobacteraceae bacterium]